MEAEQRAGKRLVTVGFMRRFDPSYQEMKQLLDAGEIGEALMSTTRTATRQCRRCTRRDGREECP